MWHITEDGPKDVVWIPHRNDVLESTESQLDRRLWERISALQDELDEQKEKTHQLRMLMEDLYQYREDSVKLARIESQLGLD